MKWHGFGLHKPCANACRCHTRLLSGEAKKKDMKLLEEDPDSWKEAVLPVVVA